MLKVLYRYGRDLPVVGDPIKFAYTANMVNKMIKKIKNDAAKKGVNKYAGDQLERIINQEANDIFDDHIRSEISDVPEPLFSQIKRKAIKKIVAALREVVEKETAVKTV